MLDIAAQGSSAGFCGHLESNSYVLARLTCGYLGSPGSWAGSAAPRTRRAGTRIAADSWMQVMLHLHGEDRSGRRYMGSIVTRRARNRKRQPPAGSRDSSLLEPLVGLASAR